MIWFLTVLIKGLSWLVASLPRGLQVFLGRVLGSFWFYVIPIRRATAIENLHLAFPQWSEGKIRTTALRNFQNYGCGFVEFCLLPHLDEKRFKKLFVVEGRDILDEAMKKNRGLFFLTLHIGSWELMSATCAALNIPLSVVTKKFKAKSLNQVWVNLRVGRGIKLIREEKSTFDILRAIRSQQAVGFILDQFMGPPVGVKTTFFGVETGTAAGLALFAGRTQAPVVPVYNVRLSDGRIKIVFEPEVQFLEQGSIDRNISFMTQRYTSKLEEIITKYPEQWLWIHRRWKPFRQ